MVEERGWERTVADACRGGAGGGGRGEGGVAGQGVAKGGGQDVAQGLWGTHES